MKIVITGGRGQLGSELERQLRDTHDVVITDLPEVDLTERAQIENLFRVQQPDLVIHCAAHTNVDGCAKDPALAYKINGLGTQNVALACQAAGAVMCHISTNEVFAGDRKNGYEEWMPLAPGNPYGVSKAAGECHVRNLLSQYYIVRLAWLYAAGGRNFIHAIIERAERDGKVRVVTDEVGNPTSVSDAAAAIGKLIGTGQYGTYHLVNQGACSRWEFANEILRLRGLTEVENEQITSDAFERASNPPPWGELHNIAGAAIGIELRTWKDALADFVK